MVNIVYFLAALMLIATFDMNFWDCSVNLFFFGKLNGFEAEMLYYILDLLKLHKWFIIIFILKKSLLSKFINSFLLCLYIWHCAYKIVLISKTNQEFPNPV